MPQTRSKLGCCDRQTTTPNIIICYSCKYKYHLSCVNINKPLKEHTEDFESKWACPGCYCKLRKSDNSNTPIRGASQQLSEQEDGASMPDVTIRRGVQLENRTTFNIEIDSIRQIYREELDSILETFKVNLFDQFELKTKELFLTLGKVSDTTISAVEKQQDILTKDLESNALQIRKLEAEQTTLQATVTDLNSRIARMEQHSRASNLEIQNTPEQKTENLRTIVEQVAATSKYNLNVSDIHVYTRVAKLNKDSHRPRSLIVKFSSPHKVRDEVLAATLRFNRKARSVQEKLNTSHIGISGNKQPVFVVEHLSPSQKAIHAAARAKAKELNFKFIWVKGGRVLMLKTKTAEYKLIKNIQDLSQLK